MGTVRSVVLVCICIFHRHTHTHSMCEFVITMKLWWERHYAWRQNKYRNNSQYVTDKQPLFRTHVGLTITCSRGTLNIITTNICLIPTYFITDEWVSGWGERFVCSVSSCCLKLCRYSWSSPIMIMFTLHRLVPTNINDTCTVYLHWTALVRNLWKI